MPWIQSHTNVERHRKTIAVAEDLNDSPVHISGHLHALWHEVLDQQEDGNLAGWSNRMIARYAQWDGDADQFADALRRRGFIDGDLIHDWLEYAGRYLQSKYRSHHPEKLQRIQELHSGQTKERPRSDLGQTVPSILSSDTNLSETVETSEKRGDARGEGTEFALQSNPPAKPKKEKLPTVVPPLPSWLPAELWQRFKDFRKEIKAPMSAEAEKIGINEITKLVEIHGEDPKAVIEQSMFRRWKGLFKVDRDLHVGPRRFDKSDVVREKTREMLSMQYDQSDKHTSGGKKR
jgi:hypothetical protein